MVSSESLFANMLMYAILVYGLLTFIAWNWRVATWGKTERVCGVVCVVIVILLWPLTRMV